MKSDLPVLAVITICTISICLGLIIIVKGINSNSTTEKRYLSVSCNTGQLGNQLWPLVTGWSVAKRLNRTLYTDKDCNFERNKRLLYQLFWTFPKLKGIVEEFEHPTTEVRLPLSTDCCSYNDTSIYANRTDKYLMIDTSFSQNVRYFEPFVDELWDLLEFGSEITERGEIIMRERNISEEEDVLCAHIRQKDFAELNWANSFEESLMAVRHVARIKSKRTLILFGDDRSFMERMLTNLRYSQLIGKKSFFSTYTEPEDLYIARSRCKTFVATSECSSFGFWLSFMLGDPTAVYYLRTNKTVSPQFDPKSRFQWNALKIVNGTVEEYDPAGTKI